MVSRTAPESGAVQVGYEMAFLSVATAACGQTDGGGLGGTAAEEGAEQLPKGFRTDEEVLRRLYFPTS